MTDDAGVDTVGVSEVRVAGTLNPEEPVILQFDANPALQPITYFAATCDTSTLCLRHR